MPALTAIRAVTVTALAMVLSGIWLVHPSWACACGALVVDDAALTVRGETSIVRWDGATEEIVMRLAVDSDAADAAWILPTPTPARVKLGKSDWFDELEELTEPRVVTRHTWWPPWKLPGADDGAGAPPGAPPVQVLDKQRIGPFQVATLAAQDSGSLAGWLDTHGYRLKGPLAEALGPYVEMGWTYVAIKLVPEDGDELSGALPPLHVTFDANRLVYPMRLSGLAEETQRLHLYVLAPHRVEGADGVPDSLDVGFAGWVEPGDVDGAALRELIGGRAFLTEFAGELSPESINGDFRFRYADRDRVYREVEYETEGIYVLGVIPAGWAVVLGVLLLVVIAALAGALVVGSRRARRVGR